MSGNVSIGTVVVLRWGGVAVARSANSRTRSGGAGRTKGCSRGGILCGKISIAALASWMP